MTMVHITKTLLESWRYCFSCYEGYEDEAYADFLKTLRREQTETTEAMLNGLAFEDRCYRAAEGKTIRTDAKWREGAQQGEVINGIVNHTTTWTAMKDTMGYTNTRLIRAMGNAAEYPAAYAVDFANGWYLPALGQLYYMMSHMAVLNNSLSVVGAQPLPVSAGSVTDDRYYWWSSSVHSMANAWRLSNGNLELGIASKTFHYYITPVKTF